MEILSNTKHKNNKKELYILLPELYFFRSKCVMFRYLVVWRIFSSEEFMISLINFNYNFTLFLTN